ncbi:PQQ-dependent sugar dehydrogenase [Flavobacterium urocaniciphilum]|uniref:Dehydrogenase, PQQ-dependent, s-GDH family n=1 Tax=Flavobacterium urocaniciphilum TaxID=1299341 RepID=A0A1H9BUZ2_9FLAO|nr:PQQ-dependent sugar dehydrogenase [Flavobacterium urocaniciphilum]SEP92689.1 dehydrogenase, PQQ-dependent, s-GDH family [Flavobacterium urocaniciphilum]
MKKIYFFLLVISTTCQYAQTPVTSGPNWTVTNLTPNNALNFPGEITYGPDGFLWITERVGKKVVRVNKTTGAISTMIDLSAQVYQTAGQDGLLGFAIHPDLYTNIATTTNNYVYIAYTYNSGGRKLRISRFTFNNGPKTLSGEQMLLENMPASNDHNSGRLKIGPDMKLYYTFGDQGNNQFANACNPILAQNLPTSPTNYTNYQGKILRINLDGTIPSDNPTLAGVQSHVYTYGHRNPQGLVFAQNGTLYSSEHGAKVDDELNIIVPGKNYGWPLIAGYFDNMSYNYCNWSTASPCNAGSFSDDVCAAGVTPVDEFTSYPSGPPSNFMPPIGTYNSTSAVVPTGGFLGWPTVAPASIDIYELNKIPNWGRSLLIPTLKKGTIYRAKLAPDGNSIMGGVYENFHSSNDRYRDIALDPDGVTFYAVTDNTGSTSGPSGSTAVTIVNPGVIVKIQYTGPTVVSPPIANCQNITTTLDTTGNVTILPSQINNNSTDDGTIVSYILDKSTFNCSHVDTPQQVYLTVVDNQGGESSCGAIVTVNNNSAFVTPTGLAVSGITNSSANLNWTSAFPATFELRYRQIGAVNWIHQTTTTNNLILQGLDPGTNYEVQIRLICETATSSYSTSVNFTTTSGYCAVTGIISAGHNYITNVELGSINNASGNNSYTYYSSVSTNLTAGTSNTIIISKPSIANAARTCGFSVWIDYNRDGDFSDSGERVAFTSSLIAASATSATLNFTVPSTISIGSTRMRVECQQTATPTVFCGAIHATNPSEAEDYMINLILPCGTSTTSWNGTAWTNGLPDSRKAVVFNANYQSTGIIEACSVAVNGTANVVFNSNHTLKVTNNVTVAAGASLTFENNASLLQINNSVNSGSIKVKRNSTPMIRQDYTAWSSPVNNQQLLAFSPNTLPSRFYEYLSTGMTTPTAYQSIVPTNNFTNGKGYMIRVADNWSPTLPTIYNGEFNGVPFNGTVSPVLGIGYNLLGNPYPSPINARTFLSDNPNINTLYYWTHTVAAVAGSYPVNNYASYTTLGGVAAAAGGAIPVDFIQVGQGFFVNTTIGGSANFNNNQRSYGSSSMQFYKTTISEEKHRIWLNLNDATYNYNQILVGYADGASNSIDTSDGLVFNDVTSMIYNLINNQKYVIQGREVPFVDTDVVPIGLKITQDGNYTISLQNFDGLFENQNIYLKDNYFFTIHDLKQGAYSFTSQTGEFNDRIQIVYKNEMLSIEEVDDLIVFAESNETVFKSLHENIKEIIVYDVLGRKLNHFQNINLNTYKTNKIQNQDQVLLLKVILNSGKILTKKHFK